MSASIKVGGGTITLTGRLSADGTFSAAVASSDLATISVAGVDQKLALSGTVSRATVSGPISSAVSGSIGDPSSNTPIYKPDDSMIRVYAIGATLDQDQGLLATGTVGVHVGGVIGEPKFNLKAAATYEQKQLLFKFTDDIDISQFGFGQVLKNALFGSGDLGTVMTVHLSWADGFSVGLDVQITDGGNQVWLPFAYLGVDVTGFRMDSANSITLTGDLRFASADSKLTSVPKQNQTIVPLNARLWIGDDGKPSAFVLGAGAAGSDSGNTIQAMIDAAGLIQPSDVAAARDIFTSALSTCSQQTAGSCVKAAEKAMAKTSMPMSSPAGKRFITVFGAVMTSYQLDQKEGTKGTGTPLVPGGKASIFALVADVNPSSGAVNLVNGGMKISLVKPFSATFDAKFNMDSTGWIVGLGSVGSPVPGISELELAYATSKHDITVGNTAFRDVEFFSIGGAINTDTSGICGSASGAVSFLFVTICEQLDLNLGGHDLVLPFQVPINMSDAGMSYDIRVGLGIDGPFITCKGSANDYTSDYVYLASPGFHYRSDYMQGAGWTTGEVGLITDVNWRTAGESSTKPGKTYSFSGQLDSMNRPGFEGVALTTTIDRLDNVFGVDNLTLKDGILTIQLGKGKQWAVGIGATFILPTRVTDPLGWSNMPITGDIVVGSTTCLQASVGVKGDTTQTLLDLGPIKVSAFSFTVIAGKGTCQIGNLLMAKNGFAISGEVLGVGVAGSLYWRDTVNPATLVAERGYDITIDIGAFDVGPVVFDNTHFEYHKNEVVNLHGTSSYSQVLDAHGGVHLGPASLTGSLSMNVCEQITTKQMVGGTKSVQRMTGANPSNSRSAVAQVKALDKRSAVLTNDQAVAKDKSAACSADGFSYIFDLEADKVGFPGFMIENFHVQGVQQSGRAWYKQMFNSTRLYSNGDIEVLGSTVKWNGGYDVIAHIPIRIWGNAQVNLNLSAANSSVTGTVGFGFSMLRPEDDYLYIGGEPICVQPADPLGNLDTWLGLGGTTPEAQCQGSVVAPNDPPSGFDSVKDGVNTIRAAMPSLDAPRDSDKGAKATLAGYDVGGVYMMVDEFGAQVRAYYNGVWSKGTLDGRLYLNAPADKLVGKTVLTPSGEVPAHNGDFSLQMTASMFPMASKWLPNKGVLMLGYANYDGGQKAYLYADVTAEILGSSIELLGYADTAGNFQMSGKFQSFDVFGYPMLQAGVTIANEYPGMNFPNMDTCQSLSDARLAASGLMVCLSGEVKIPDLIDVQLSGVFGTDKNNPDIPGMVLRGSADLAPGGFKIASASVLVDTFPSSASFTATGHLQVGSVFDADAMVTIQRSGRFYVGADATLHLPGGIGNTGANFQFTNCSMNQVAQSDSEQPATYKPDCTGSGPVRLIANAGFSFAQQHFYIGADVASNGNFSVVAYAHGHIHDGFDIGSKKWFGFGFWATMDWKIRLVLSNSDVSAALSGEASVDAYQYNAIHTIHVHLGVGLCGKVGLHDFAVGVKFEVFGKSETIGSCG
ncbi:MAG: hypothetical protein WCP28_15935 [Actinomycetes bacterium]